MSLFGFYFGKNIILYSFKYKDILLKRHISTVYKQTIIRIFRFTFKKTFTQLVTSFMEHCSNGGFSLILVSVSDVMLWHHPRPYNVSGNYHEPVLCSSCYSTKCKCLPLYVEVNSICKFQEISFLRHFI